MRLNQYVIRARLFPAIIFASPLLFVYVVFMPYLENWFGILTLFSFSSLLAFCASELSRDAGKKIETALFLKAGGKPTTRMLRHSDRTLPDNTKRRYHAFFEQNIPNFLIPTKAQEKANLVKADSTYESAIDWLIIRSRNTEKFQLLFSENISYGFRRNLFGLKIPTVILSILAVLLIILIPYFYNDILFSKNLQYCSLLALFLEIITITSIVKWQWVIVPAEAYARRLLELCDEEQNNLNTNKGVIKCK